MRGWVGAGVCVGGEGTRSGSDGSQALARLRHAAATAAKTLHEPRGRGDPAAAKACAGRAAAAVHAQCYACESSIVKRETAMGTIGRPCCAPRASGNAPSTAHPPPRTAAAGWRPGSDNQRGTLCQRRPQAPPEPAARAKTPPWRRQLHAPACLQPAAWRAAWSKVWAGCATPSLWSSRSLARRQRGFAAVAGGVSCSGRPQERGIRKV